MPLIRRGPLKTFLFFLGFSTVIWIFVQFSKQYTEEIEFPLDYVNIPKDKIIMDGNPKTLELRIRENGFRIAYKRLITPKLQIDLSQAREESGRFIYDLEQQRSAILNQLNTDFENVYFPKNTIRINYDQREVKKIPIVPDFELNFAVGYSALEEINIQPDSVTVSGPKTILDTLESVSTNHREINNISSDIKGEVGLDNSKLGGVRFYEDEVTYSLRTEKFTEGQVEIPIEVVNLPENTNIAIFPKDVMVYFQVSLDDFNKVKPSQFKVVVDYQKAGESEEYLLANIVKKPDFINNVRLNENKIQFVIKK